MSYRTMHQIQVYSENGTIFLRQENDSYDSENYDLIQISKDQVELVCKWLNELSALPNDNE